MKTFLMVVQLITSIILIASVLLQSGKSAGLSGSIAGGAEQVMGTKARGLDALFSKITSVSAFLFIIVALSLVAIQ
ncbi:preprotein translocase subunit SecG [Tepidibacter formicigenes]|uniref:Protein-export membrane protein SecG n=1 Tax=Tepidibacter formicigenes DSM 15518 TaxID=1123349 RepID=A0A1M6MK88_9FIRM|nr:preprotein translocase subunit SecG [Tepidibacter formicigenes]SHJ83867.1 preprotein translocase subunit SecG [Tepidibacter formicigenes DSM 15518]